MELKESILPKGFVIEDKYSILLFIKKGSYAETYRLKGEDGKLYFLKLFDSSKLHRNAFDKEGNVLEIEYYKKISHPSIAKYECSGELICDGRKYLYLIQNFIPGETLSARLNRERINTIYDIKLLITGILDALEYLHGMPDPIIHNEITPDNIMLDLSVEPYRTKLIDFGYARSFYQSTKAYNRVGLNLNYVASECFNNLYSPQSDLYSVGAVMYHMIFGIPPWCRDVSKFEADRTKVEELLLAERQKPLEFPNVISGIIDFDNSILHILSKALQPAPEYRFQNAIEFKKALAGEIQIADIRNDKSPDNHWKPANSNKAEDKKGKGFEAIAGMSGMKEQLKHDVINVIENPEEYKKHNLGLPNGMLLYGPPGCGKTFFAEKFAEEAGYNFIKVISSDLASIYVHGSQEKIGKLFKEAREKAPTILYFDELDAMVPNRERLNNQSQSGEVNEFLSQLDNIGNSGVFVIGSTNKPDLIDSAILRAGRLEKWFYIPPPDFEARRAMFELYLKDRPLDFGIDYERLASLTDNYVSSDIRFLIDETSRKTIRENLKRITMTTLESVINTQKPTVSAAELKKYEQLHKKIEGDTTGSEQTGRRRIGF